MLGFVHLVTTLAAARVTTLVSIGRATAPRIEAAAAATSESLAKNCILKLEAGKSDNDVESRKMMRS